MLRRRRRLSLALLALMLAAGIFLVFRHAILPAYWTPLPALDLAEPDGWFVDWRLAEMQGDRTLCARVLQQPWIETSPIADGQDKGYCGWTNSVRISGVNGIRLHMDKATCQLAAALALWLTHDVRPAAQRLLGSRVVAIQHFGGYACRNIKGAVVWARLPSQHAHANAVDIAGFTLSDGKQVTVLRHWSGSGPETRFLHEVHRRACHTFRVAIGPDFNAAHHDHFHLDRGPFSACK